MPAYPAAPATPLLPLHRRKSKMSRSPMDDGSLSIAATSEHHRLQLAHTLRLAINIRWR